MFNSTSKEIVKLLQVAGVRANVSTARDGSDPVDAECDVTARDVLGMERFRDYFKGVEVTIV